MEAVPVPFRLREGMSAYELLDEVKGRIAGENAEAVQVFERSLKVTRKSIPTLSIKVHEESKTAVVRVTERTLDQMGLPQYGASRSWVMGINDEGSYFAHEIQGVPKTVHDLTQLISWMNRTDEGFTQRIQGDILLQFIPLRHHVYDTDPDEIRLARGPVLNVPIWVSHRDINLGNHRILVPDKGLAGTRFKNGTEYAVVSAQELIMLHEEHGMQRLKIPFDHAAVITYQRGRTDAAPVD